VEGIEGSPRFVQLLTHFLCRLCRKRFVPDVILVGGLLIVPVRIWNRKIQLLIVNALIIADVPEFEGCIAHMTDDIGIRLVDSANGLA
jgi:hypothetical protein